MVQAAQQALETKNVNLVLIWVAKADEPEISEAFRKTVAIRSLNHKPKNSPTCTFSRRWFRIHRAGEGEPYTGLKPAGRELGPAIPTADKALKSRKLEPLLKLLTEEMHESVRKNFENVLAKKDYQANDVEAGREYVDAYVSSSSRSSGFDEATKSPARGHSEKSRKAEMDKEEKH